MSGPVIIFARRGAAKSTLFITHERASFPLLSEWIVKQLDFFKRTEKRNAAVLWKEKRERERFSGH